MSTRNGIQLLASGNIYELEVKVRRFNGLIVSGLAIGDATYQNQAFILLANKGELKEYPTLGVGINDICHDTDFSSWRRSITEQLEADGQRIEALEINETGLKLDAKYK